MKLPSSSLRATRTSSSSSTDSVFQSEIVQVYVIMGGSRTVEEGDELLSSAFGTQGQSDGGETSDGIEAEDDIVVLYSRSVLCPELFHMAMEALGWGPHTFSSSMSTAMG